MEALQPGTPYPLGATWDGAGVNFAVFAEFASAVDVCLFDHPDAVRESVRIPLTTCTDFVWHGYIPNLRPGQLYAFRVAGPHLPWEGQRYNPHKLLIDPYAKAIHGQVNWTDAVFGYPIGSGDSLIRDERDSAPYMPRCVVIDPSFDWEHDQLLQIPLHESIIYEMHVKGFTALHPELPPELRGTYAGLASAPVIDYLQKLGVTAVELLPVHHFLDNRYLTEQGLRNYWGYSTIGFFAPEARYSSSGDAGQQVKEFKHMVKQLHMAGIEVILDVVYNHTAEGNHFGPTLSMKGFDNRAYYRLMPDAQYYLDYTGTGNTLNILHPRTLQLVMDSLRYWVLEMHVDGFRFDLASTLARGLYEGDRLSAFFDTIHQDPVLSQVKLIAEPWDIGPGGYQVGNFPVRWAEWNGQYRDTVRRYWKNDEALVAELAYRLSGSSDLYENTGRKPYASINFITAHDGFTLRDLVSYNEKHNWANGEENRDGESHNNSWNCGVEGPTNDPQITRLRAQQQRNFLATLFLSQGVPMLLAGDESNRTQQGNNNAYCQDNEISWHTWNHSPEDQALLEWTRMLIKIRHAHPVFHRRNFFQGRAIHGQDIHDIEWYRPDGQMISEGEWQHGAIHAFGMQLNGQYIDDVDDQGRAVQDDIFLLLFNPGFAACHFSLPGDPATTCWQRVFDTAQPDAAADYPLSELSYSVDAHALVLLRQQGQTAPPEQTIRLQQPDHILRQATPSATSATLITLSHIWSTEQNHPYNIHVYLPPSYDNPDHVQHYPVLYTLLPYQQAQRAALQHMLSVNNAAELIMVFVPVFANTTDSHTPAFYPENYVNTTSALLAFMLETLKPLIDERFRSLPDRHTTGLFDWHVPGTPSLAALLNYPHYVGAAATCFSQPDPELLTQLEAMVHIQGSLFIGHSLTQMAATHSPFQSLLTLLEQKEYHPVVQQFAQAMNFTAFWQTQRHELLKILFG